MAQGRVLGGEMTEKRRRFCDVMLSACNSMVSSFRAVVLA